MALNTTNPTGTEAWKNLQNHYNATHKTTIQELFQQDNARVEKFNLQWNDFLVDYSKNNISQETVSLLLELANSIGLKEAISQYFEGAIINQTKILTPRNQAVYLESRAVPTETPTASHHKPCPVSISFARKNRTKALATSNGASGETTTVPTATINVRLKNNAAVTESLASLNRI